MASSHSSPSQSQNDDAALVRRWQIAAALALGGALNPLPLPLSGLHKFYLGQPLWGGIYLLLNWTQIPRIACVVEGAWYLFQVQRCTGGQSRPGAFISDNKPSAAQQVHGVAAALRDLEQLRKEGLVSEAEFEQHRRSLLAKLR